MLHDGELQERAHGAGATRPTPGKEKGTTTRTERRRGNNTSQSGCAQEIGGRKTSTAGVVQEGSKKAALVDKARKVHVDPLLATIAF